MNNKWLVGVLGSVSATALNCSALAAPPPTSTYSWTGFYGGLHMGAGWPQDPDATVTGQWTFPRLPTARNGFNSPASAFPFGGVQIGYNWQFQPQWVVGLEIGFSVSKHTEKGATLIISPLTDAVTSTRGIDWFGTVRGRLGYLITPSLLAYGTGGLVYGHTRNDFTQAITGPSPFGSYSIVDGTRDVSTGWTAGGGFEWALDRQWSIKLEYDYLSFDDAVASTTKIRVLVGKSQLPLQFSSDVQSPNNSAHTIQIGLNYHFWN